MIQKDQKMIYLPYLEKKNHINIKIKTLKIPSKMTLKNI